MSEALTIRSTDGLALEAHLDAPDRARAALVLCHPHPKMGGTMNAPLLESLVESLNARGWTVLRFNFRGIGASEGEHGLGLDEVQDAAGALAEMQSRFDLPLAVAGWSFGAAVAVRAAQDAPYLKAVVGIAPAVTEKPGITAGLPAAEEVEIPGELLVVCGANDDLVDPKDAAAWATAAGGRYAEINGANHFFWARYEQLNSVVGDFLDETV